MKISNLLLPKTEKGKVCENPPAFLAKPSKRHMRAGLLGPVQYTIYIELYVLLIKRLFALN